METQFRLRLTKTSAPARFFSGLAGLALFLGFGWLILTQNISTGKLMGIMLPSAVVLYFASRFWLTYEALVTVAATQLLVEPLKTEQGTVVSFSEVASFSLEKARNIEVLRFKRTDGTTQELDGVASKGDTFADFVRAVEQAAAQYRTRHPGFMVPGEGLAEVPSR